MRTPVAIAAARAVVAFTGRIYQHRSGFMNGLCPGIMIFNHYFYPEAWAYKRPDGKYVLAESVSSREAYSRFLENHAGPKSRRNSFVNSVMWKLEKLPEGRDGESAFRKCVFDSVMALGMTPAAEKALAGKTREVGTDEAFRTLTRKYSVGINMFRDMFGEAGYGEDDVVKAGDFEYLLEDTPLTADDVRELSAQVVEALPGSLRGLCYGRIEVKGRFRNSMGQLGDYVNDDDMIRIGCGREDFVGTMVHELGHRWAVKMATREQFRAFALQYARLMGRKVKIRAGDTVEYEDGKSYVFKGMTQDGRTLVMEDPSDGGERRMANRLNKMNIRSVNGVPVEKLAFPTEYSKKNVDEFIAECFEYHFLGKIEDAALDGFVRSQLGA